jgi:GntR family transcriptional regulator / MocR family aminotransferase
MTNPVLLDALFLDRDVGAPLHWQLYDRLRGMIEERALIAGSLMPSSRALASDLGVARNTVISAYDQLTTEGYLVSRLRSRPVVADLPGSANPSAHPEITDRRQVSARGRLMLDQPVHHGSPGHLTLHPGMPAAEEFPFNTWSKLLARRAKVARHDLFGTYHIAGYPALREAVASYVRVSRGVRCTPEQVVITTGVQAALDLLARLLLDPGDAAWVEEPGYYGAQSALVAAGARLLPLRVDDDGWSLELPPGEAPKLIYVTPACQHPLGVTMLMEQRLRLLELADRLDAWIIEDDFDGEYRFQGRPVPALQSIDRLGRVIYLGTFAKLLFPALRLGFMVLPPALLDGMPRALSTTGQFAPLLLQAALADFIGEGHMALHLGRMRRLYAARRQAFCRLAAEHLGHRMTLHPTDAGIQIVGRMRGTLGDRAVASAAEARGIHVSPLSIHYRHAAPASGLAMGYAATSEAAMPQALRQLEAAFRDIEAG